MKNPLAISLVSEQPDTSRNNGTASRHLAQVLSPLFQVADAKLFNKNEELFSPKTSENDVFWIEKGLIGLYVGKDGEGLTPVNYKTNGEVTGYHSLFYLGANGCTARAVVPTLVRSVSKTDFLKHVTESSQYRDTLFSILSVELMEYESRMKSLSQKSVRERVAELLVYLSQKIGVEREGKIEVPNLIRRKELAGFIGTSTEHLVRQLGDLKDKRLIQTEGQSIFVLDLPGLKSLSKSRD